MTIKKEYIVIAGWVLVAIAATILLTSIFGGSKKPDEKLYDQLMEEKQARIDELNERLDSETELRKELVETYEQHIRSDSLLRDELIKNQVKYNSVNKGYADIPNRINSISGDDAAIKRAFADY